MSVSDTSPNDRLRDFGMAVIVNSRTRTPGQSDIEDFTGSGEENAVKAGNIASERLRSIVDRIERLEEERASLASDTKDIFTEAKSGGFDAKALRALLRLRKMEPSLVEEQEALLLLYRQALGM